jgi:tRNA nucleotidyltransferase (CCA-adding enzyme)
VREAQAVAAQQLAQRAPGPNARRELVDAKRDAGRAQVEGHRRIIAARGARVACALAPARVPASPHRCTGLLRTLRAMQLRVPPPVRALVETLHARGHAALLVGGCVRDALRGTAVRDWDVATSASVEELLAIFPRAIPVGASARHGTAMVPTAAGPVDVTRFRGADLAEDLARRDFTVNAMAYDLAAERLLDPHGGAADLAGGRLRAVGSAAERLTEDPLRALRAARLVAELALAPDVALELALAQQSGALAGVAPERVRAELTRTLLGPRASEGLALLRRTGLEAALAPGVRADAAAVVGALPADLALRLAALLRGASRGRFLAKLRFGRPLARTIDRLLSLHPIDASWDGSLQSARRLPRRAGDEATLARLLALREAECAAAGDASGSARIAALREALAAGEGGVFGPADLALRGDEVMRSLGRGPGPHIGRALRHLVECVVANPADNTPERLRARLSAWRDDARARPAEA